MVFNDVTVLMTIISLLAIAINAIGITVGISYAYASVPISLGLVLQVLVINYECKNTLMMGKDSTPETYFSIGFGLLISAHYSTLGWVDDTSRVQAIHWC